MKKNVFAKIALIAAAGFAVNAFATTAPIATFNVKITINKACTVTAPTDLNFGAQDSTATAINESTAGKVTVTCSKNTPYKIALRPSTANTGTDNGTGNMKSATTSELVPYSLYSDASRATVWGNLATNSLSGNRLNSATVSTDYPVYGKVASVDVTPATDYIDAVTVTLTY